MMATIQGLGGLTRPPAARRRSAAGGFQVNTDKPPMAGAPEAAAASGVDQVSLTGLLAMQEAGAGTVRDRAARRHGQRMLALLRELQQAMLSSGEAGTVDVARRLAELTATDCPPDDPRLGEILRAIAVRAAVELARHDGSVSDLS